MLLPSGGLRVEQMVGAQALPPCRWICLEAPMCAQTSAGWGTPPHAGTGHLSCVPRASGTLFPQRWPSLDSGAAHARGAFSH